MTVTLEQIEAGQAIYNRRTLAAYDLVVLSLSNRLIWKCPTSRLLQHYNQYITANHLDVGVGTGYFLDHCRFPERQPRVALMDLNRNSLTYAAARIARYRPEIYRHNVLAPIDVPVTPFDSIGINYLLHCLPGSMATKSVVFDHLAAVMNPGGVLFGATLLQRDVATSVWARLLTRLYNRRGIFSNGEDRLDDLESALRDRFRQVFVEVVGCAALFSARIE